MVSLHVYSPQIAPGPTRPQNEKYHSSNLIYLLIKFCMELLVSYFWKDKWRSNIKKLLCHVEEVLCRIYMLEISRRFASNFDWICWLSYFWKNEREEQKQTYTLQNFRGLVQNKHACIQRIPAVHK